MTSTTTLATVDFHGQALTVITSGNERLVAMKPICDNIGLDWKGQYNRIQRDEVLNSTMVVTTTVAQDGKQREVICLPLNMINGWLFGIDVARCRKEIQPALIQYKRECYAVLAAHWQKLEQPQPQAPSLNSRRWLISYDHAGNERISEVPADAAVTTTAKLLASVGEPCGLLFETADLIALVSAASEVLKHRLDYQAKQLHRAREAGFLLS